MISEEQLRKRIKLEAFKAGGQKHYAAAIGVAATSLSMFLSGARKPSKVLLEAIGYDLSLERRYRKKVKGQKHG